MRRVARDTELAGYSLKKDEWVASPASCAVNGYVPMNPALTLPVMLPFCTVPVNCSVSFIGWVI